MNTKFLDIYHEHFLAFCSFIQQECQHLLTGQRAANFTCVSVFMMYNASEFVVFRLY